MRKNKLLYFGKRSAFRQPAETMDILTAVSRQEGIKLPFGQVMLAVRLAD
jgi:hypothetical protein